MRLSSKQTTSSGHLTAQFTPSTRSAEGPSVSCSPTLTDWWWQTLRCSTAFCCPWWKNRIWTIPAAWGRVPGCSSRPDVSISLARFSCTPRPPCVAPRRAGAGLPQVRRRIHGRSSCWPTPEHQRRWRDCSSTSQLGALRLGGHSSRGCSTPTRWWSRRRCGRPQWIRPRTMWCSIYCLSITTRACARQSSFLRC